MAGWIDADHHGPVDAVRVAPGVDHCGARPDALAEEVDPVVTERLPDGLEVLHLLRQPVAGDIDSLALQARGARTEAVHVRVQRLLGEGVWGVRDGGLNLLTVEANGPFHAAVTHEDDIVVLGEAARP
jgi:hypothetical protein